MDPAVVERLVEEAERRARASNIGSMALAPFLLQALAESSGGATLRTSRALLVANAGTAAEVARHLPTARRHNGGDIPGIRHLPH